MRLAAIRRLIDQALDSEKRCRQAAGKARMMGQEAYAKSFDHMADYQAWRAEQIRRLQQGQRDHMPTWAEWQATEPWRVCGQVQVKLF